MFDTTTARLIRSAPALDGLDLERLPEDLTAAYSELVAFRVANRRRRDIVPAERLERLRRLANTYEALTIVGAPDENAAAAFVAASAHRLLALGSTVGLMPPSTPDSRRANYSPRGLLLRWPARHFAGLQRISVQARTCWAKLSKTHSAQRPE